MNKIKNKSIMTPKERVKYLEDEIQKEIWGLQMLDYVTPSTTDDLDRMQKELKGKL